MIKERNHKRIVAPQGTPVLAFGGMCRVDDISHGGISIKYVEDNSLTTNFPKEVSLDLLSTENTIVAKKMPGEFVWDEKKPLYKTPGLIIRKVGIKFGKLSARQKNQLKKVILNYMNHGSELCPQG